MGGVALGALRRRVARTRAHARRFDRARSGRPHPRDPLRRPGRPRRVQLLLGVVHRHAQHLGDDGRRLPGAGAVHALAPGVHQHGSGVRVPRRRPPGHRVRDRAADRAGGRRTRIRSDRTAAPQLHPERRIPLPDRQRHGVRLRRLRGRAGQGAGAGRLRGLCRKARRRAAPRPAARHRRRVLPGGVGWRRCAEGPGRLRVRCRRRHHALWRDRPLGAGARDFVRADRRRGAGAGAGGDPLSGQRSGARAGGQQHRWIALAVRRRQRVQEPGRAHAGAQPASCGAGAGRRRSTARIHTRRLARALRRGRRIGNHAAGARAQARRAAAAPARLRRRVGVGRHLPERLSRRRGRDRPGHRVDAHRHLHRGRRPGPRGVAAAGRRTGARRRRAGRRAGVRRAGGLRPGQRAAAHRQLHRLRDAARRPARRDPNRRPPGADRAQRARRQGRRRVGLLRLAAGAGQRDDVGVASAGRAADGHAVHACQGLGGDRRRRPAGAR